MPERLLWGSPMGHYHQGFHGMEFGPNGDLFLSMGDPQPHLHWDRSRPDHLWHWTFYIGPENKSLLINLARPIGKLKSLLVIQTKVKIYLQTEDVSPAISTLFLGREGT
jgi:hypothetical protein